uniref:Uncharacterized protein n=1 Tax=Panagrolaimus sp. ES5 TaxID=591445 RepID=A0AC34GK28_9BILA
MNFNDDKILITYIKSSPIPGSVDILTINSLNEAIIHEFCFDIPSGDVPTFFKFIPAFIKREVKAVILQLSEFQHPEFTNNIQLRIMISKEYEKHGIKYCFIDSVSFLLTQILVAANLDLKMGESLLIATAGEDIVVGYDLTKS